MAKKQSSRKPPTKKAATRARSTTSSTTETSSVSDVGLRLVNLDQPEPRLLDRAEQIALLQLLLRGASPLAACQQLGYPASSFLKTFSEENDFRDQYYAVLTLLSQNVLAALYKQAMEGSLSAQTNWLKAMPPPGWESLSAMETLPAFTFNEVISELSDDELLDLARTLEITMPGTNQTNVS